MPEPIDDKPPIDRVTARLIEREAMRRAAADLNAQSPAGLEGKMARISAEVTEEAERRRAGAAGQR